MALIHEGQSKRVDIPHEPGQWLAFRRLSVRELRDRPDLSTKVWTDLDEAAQAALALRWVQAAATDWSYDEPFSVDACERLDAVTAIWAYVTAIARTFGGETPEEKKADLPGSTPGLTASPAPTVPETG